MHVQTNTNELNKQEMIVHLIIEPTPDAKVSLAQHLRQNYDTDMTYSAVCVYFAIVAFFALFLIMILNSRWDDDDEHLSYWHAHSY